MEINKSKKEKRNMSLRNIIKGNKVEIEIGERDIKEVIFGEVRTKEDLRELVKELGEVLKILDGEKTEELRKKELSSLDMEYKKELEIIYPNGVVETTNLREQHMLLYAKITRQAKKNGIKTKQYIESLGLTYKRKTTKEETKTHSKMLLCS